LKWLEVSISLSGELAEAVSDLLSRHAPGGIVIEAPSSQDESQKFNQVILRAYLPADKELETRHHAIEEGLWHLNQIQSLPQPQYRFLEEQDWEQAWKSHYHPIKIGRRLVIQPAWLPLQEKERLPIFIDPGMAFGTGTHPTTQLCLHALEEYLCEGQSVIDLGCGSGILSIAAARLGAASVLALDIDPIAVRNTRENARRNAVDHIVTAQQGSLDLLINNGGRNIMQASIVLANILAKTLQNMIESGLGKTIPMDGVLILSGILDHQVADVEATCNTRGLEIFAIKCMEDWRALIVKRIPPN
jgi:ribosomal protein L11 methyltransferase